MAIIKLSPREVQKKDFTNIPGYLSDDYFFHLKKYTFISFFLHNEDFPKVQNIIFPLVLKTSASIQETKIITWVHPQTRFLRNK